MTTEVRLAMNVRIPDNPVEQAKAAQTILPAWQTFIQTIKDTNPVVTEFYIGPAKDQPVRRRRGRPRLVQEPPTAA